MFPFYIPWKYQKTKGFMMFSGGYKMGTLARNGLRTRIIRMLAYLMNTHTSSYQKKLKPWIKTLKLFFKKALSQQNNIKGIFIAKIIKFLRILTV